MFDNNIFMIIEDYVMKIFMEQPASRSYTMGFASGMYKIKVQ